MKGFEGREARYLVIAVAALAILAVVSLTVAIAIRMSRRDIQANPQIREQTDSISGLDLIIPREMRQLAPLEWTALIDPNGSMPGSVLERYTFGPEDIDLDALRRKTDESMQKSFEYVQ